MFPLAACDKLLSQFHIFIQTTPAHARVCPSLSLPPLSSQSVGRVALDLAARHFHKISTY